MVCTGRKLPQPWRTLECPAAYDHRTLCAELQAADKLPLSSHMQNDARIEEALIRSTVGRCAGWLLRLISKQHICASEVPDLVPHAIHECKSSVNARQERSLGFALLRFYISANHLLVQNASTKINRSDALLHACLATSSHLQSDGELRLAFISASQPRPRPYVTSTPVDLRCPQAALPKPNTVGRILLCMLPKRRASSHPKSCLWESLKLSSRDGVARHPRQGAPVIRHISKFATYSAHGRGSQT